MVEAQGRSFPFEGIEALTPDVLETFDYEYAGRDAMVEEFSVEISVRVWR